jgi:hypothetical protein
VLEWFCPFHKKKKLKIIIGGIKIFSQDPLGITKLTEKNKSISILKA